VIAVDLLPPDEARAATRRRRARRLVVLGAAAIAAELMLAHGVIEVGAHLTSGATARARAERAALERPVAALRRLRERQAALGSRLAVLRRLEGDAGSPARLLTALAAATPPRLWLTELQLIGGRLQLVGFAPDDRTIADFAARLHTIPALRELDLEDAARDGRAASAARRFVIAGRVGDDRW
jgi:type IV pilus assembly protein PilN